MYNIFQNNNRLISLCFGLILSAPYSYIAYTVIGIDIIPLLLINWVSFYLLLRNMDLLKTPLMRGVYIAISVLKFTLLIFNARTKAVVFTGVDWGNYDRLATKALELGGSIIDIYNNSFDLFVFLIALVYKVFGSDINQIFFFILPLSFILFRYVYKSVYLLTTNEKKAAIAALLIIAWPANIVFSVSVLREMAIQTLIAASFYYFIRYIKVGKGLTQALLVSLAATLMHSGMIAVPLVYIYFALQGRKDSSKYRLLNAKSLIVIALGLVFIVGTPLWSSIGKQFVDVTSTGDVAKSLEVRSASLSDANTNYVNDVPQSTLGAIVSAPYRLVMFIFSPFLWQVYNLNTLIALIIDALPHAILIFLLWKILNNRNHLTAADKKIVLVAITAMISVFILFSFGTNNYGTAMRHRLKVLPIGVITAVSYGHINNRRRYE